MATTNNAPRRVGDFNPDTETGATLDEIEGQDVTIASVAFDQRRGRKGEYTLSIITLDNGSIYHTGSDVIAESLGKVPLDAFPILATFRLEASQSNPGQKYWTVK